MISWGFLNVVCRMLCAYAYVFSLSLSLHLYLSLCVYNYACVYVLYVLCMYEIGGGEVKKFQLNGCGERNDGELY